MGHAEQAPTKSPVRKRETAAEIKARLCSTGKPIVHYAGTKYEKDVTATYCGTGSGAAATTPTKACHLSAAQHPPKIQDDFEVINPHTVGSLTIPRASIKWV